jgi:hypothetical protein
LSSTLYLNCAAILRHSRNPAALLKALVEHFRQPDARLIQPLANDRQIVLQVPRAHPLTGLDPLPGLGNVVGCSRRKQGFRRPILDRTLGGVIATLQRRQLRKFLDPEILAPAYALDQAAIPQTEHVCPAIEEPHLRVVSTLIVIIAHVHRHVHVFDAVDE